MHPEDSPFPLHWWGTDLGDLAPGERQPFAGTYGQYDFHRLPPLPFVLRGDLNWLAHASPHEAHIGLQRRADNERCLTPLRVSAAGLGLALPGAFTKFMADPALQAKVRSNTDCYLDLCPAVVPSPIGGGHLVRFLSDSQGCLFWYLYFVADGSDHAVVSSPDYYGLEEEQWQEDVGNSGQIAFCAESFEAFLCRFWLENEIWFSQYDKRPMSPAGQQYIDAYFRQA